VSFIPQPPKPTTQWLNGPAAETTVLSQLPEPSIRALAETVGTLPPMGERSAAPAAWYISVHPDVLGSYAHFQRDHQAWRDRLVELCEISGFDPKTTKVNATSEGALNGLVVYPRPDGAPSWWRETKQGYLVPRQRTKAEKASDVFTRFKKLHTIPRAIDYVPGLSHSVWLDGPEMSSTVYPVHLRKPRDGTAVLAFLAANPDMAREPFLVGPQWARMKLSMYHAIKERQEAAAQL
jgi:hypothetical protein